ncbi:MAG: hypothetical protein E7222_12890 [Clostridiales bacterium]|nr:hypothetical protein [Clostridiales bacterium]
MQEKEIYYELFEMYKKRVKSKHLTMEAFIFERKSGYELSWAAHRIADRTWNVKGYFPFQVYHPTREINAPMYIDRIIEQWYVVKYIQTVFVPQLYPLNMACQKGKGPFLAMDYVKIAINMMYEKYGTDWYVFQFDAEGYFDNFNHETAKHLFQEIGEEGYWIYERIVDSFHIPDGYAAMSDADNKTNYGVPKGTLPSQWTGVILLNELDWEFHDNPDCDFNIRYMDDGLNFFHTKEMARKAYEDVKEFLRVNDFGIRLHKRKTYYAPISRGFTFCGWRYSLEKDGTIHVRIKNSKKKEMEHRLKVMSDEVRTGKMSPYKALKSREGIFEYLSHGTESKNLMKYMRRQYPISLYK